MNISIIGAAGMVGSALAAEAEERGHQVIRYTRSGSQPGARALDFSDTPAVKEVIEGGDVTVISVASRDDYDAAVAAHRALIDARPRGRFIVIGGAGALQAGEGLLLESPDFPSEYLPEATAFAAVHQAYHESEGLEWSMIAPSPMIAPGARTGEYKVGLDTPAGDFVSAEDFAVAAVDEIEQPRHAGRRFTVASRDEAVAQD